MQKCGTDARNGGAGINDSLSTIAWRNVRDYYCGSGGNDEGKGYKTG